MQYWHAVLVRALAYFGRFRTHCCYIVGRGSEEEQETRGGSIVRETMRGSLVYSCCVVQLRGFCLYLRICCDCRHWCCSLYRDEAMRRVKWFGVTSVLFLRCCFCGVVSTDTRIFCVVLYCRDYWSIIMTL